MTSVQQTPRIPAESPSIIARFWRRIPVIVRAVTLSLLISVVAVSILGSFAELNRAVWPDVPWGAAATLAGLWCLWRYLGGTGWPRATSSSRASTLRAVPVRGSLLKWSALAGGFGAVAVFGGYLLAMKTTLLPAEVYRIPPPFDEMPVWTTLIWSLTIAIVAGVSEEAAFRGYLQEPLERRYGGGTAITLTALIFAAAHLPQARVTAATVLAIAAGGLMLCVLAWASRSILPGVVVHTAIDMVSVPLRNLGVVPPRPYSETGVDTVLILSIAMTLVFGLASILAFSRLVRLRRTQEPQR